MLPFTCLCVCVGWLYTHTHTHTHTLSTHGPIYVGVVVVCDFSDGVFGSGAPHPLEGIIAGVEEPTGELSQAGCAELPGQLETGPLHSWSECKKLSIKTGHPWAKIMTVLLLLYMYQRGLLISGVAKYTDMAIGTERLLFVT